MERTYYDVLGVRPDASPEELAEARERRARVLGDGAGPRPAPEREAVAAALLEQLDQAFSILDDEETRHAYDTALETGAPADPQLLEEVDARFHDQFVATVPRLAERLSRYVHALSPDLAWAAQEAAAPWDLTLEAHEGEALRVVSLKVLPDLHPGDLVGTIESAEARLARCGAGHPQTYAFFLVAGLLLETGRLFTLAEEFNRASWVDRDPGDPRAFLAYVDLDGNLPVIPGVEAPIPDLAQVCAAVDPEELPADMRPVPTGSSPGTGPAEPPPAVTPNPEDPGEDEVFHVLVVDDERLPFQMIAKALEGEPFELHHARNWMESRQVLEERDCAVMVLDLNLPSLGGDKLAMYVHSHPDIQPKPRIVIHSGLAADELRRIAARVGAHACLQKGCGPNAIRQAVRSGAKAYTRDQLLTGPW